jgi:hypothetical protein
MTTDALDKFNDVLEALSIQNLAVYASVDTVVPLVANQAAYILGPGGVGQRPLSMDSIDSARTTFGGVDFPLEIVAEDVDYDAMAGEGDTGHSGVGSAGQRLPERDADAVPGAVPGRHPDGDPAPAVHQRQRRSPTRSPCRRAIAA